MLEGWTKLPYGPVVSFISLKLFYVVYQIPMSKKHPAAAVSLYTQFIHDLSGIVSFIHTVSIDLIDITDHLSTGETSYRDDHVSHHLYDFWRFFLAPRPMGCFGNFLLGSETNRLLS